MVAVYRLAVDRHFRLHVRHDHRPRRPENRPAHYLCGLCGGLAIESWGTQTNLWHYYTAERPPLWIIPAWPIASLSIDRLTRLLEFFITKLIKEHDARNLFTILYWLTFASFLSIMFVFVAPTFDKSYTWLSLGLCILLILTPTDHRFALLIFIAGAW